MTAEEAHVEFTTAVGVLCAGNSLSVGRRAADAVRIALVPRQNQQLYVVGPRPT